MSFHLSLAPAGTLILRPDPDSPKTSKPLSTFHSILSRHSEAAALFSLAIQPTGTQLPGAYEFWRSFGSRWLRERCLLDAHVADDQSIRDLSENQARSIIDSSPLMDGGEYLSAELLQAKWRSLDDWLLQELQSTDSSFADFMQARAPDWKVGGTLYFHLAENRTNVELPFAFIATWQPQQTGNNKHIPLSKALEHYSSTQQKGLLRDLLEPVQLAAQSSDLIAQLIESRAIYRAQAWNPHQAWQFLKEVPLLQNCGVIVRLPDWWAKRSRPRVSATLSNSTGSIGAEQLLNFKISTVLDGEKLTAKEWSQLMNAETGLVFLKGKWVEVDQDKLHDAMQQMQTLATEAQNDGLTFAQGMRLLAGAAHNLDEDRAHVQTEAWRFVEAGPALSKTLAKMRDPEQLTTSLPANALKAQLRPYQMTGARWLWHLNRLGLGACLADDMGLGKTIQVITLLLMIRKQTRPVSQSMPSLLVLPTSLLGNWKAELEKFAPSLACCFVHKAITDNKTLLNWAKKGLPENTDLVLTSYGTLPRQKWLNEQSWHTVILDEAQAIKNAGTRQSKTVKQLQSQARIALTGTPIENRLSDLWSLFDFINPGLLGSFKQFSNFAKALDQRETEKYTPLRNLVQPYVLRRLKTDKQVIADLPDKCEVITWCGLSKKQAAHYQRVVDDLRKTLQSSDGIKRRGIVLATMIRFKQICNHPSQLTGDNNFSPDDSGKLQRLADLCDEISQRQEKVLVFTQFREMCKPLENFLSHCFKRSGLILHGGTAAKKRQSLVTDFQSESGPPFFVLSLKAGGTGLNLTAASHVIHFDRWWNPAVENQATDRAFRIGQKRNVMVHKFVCRGTIEEQVNTMLQEKSKLATEMLEGGNETSLTELSDDELIKLVSLDLVKAQTELGH
ncbi:hypothetical protein AB833_26655 [Chromatiales bacterium (ex Bugula neritina AB1)]|nr:hypothetical protein AB833_26655 [Chromatiales bacterium (ex Bugula neritina AB1)]